MMNQDNQSPRTVLDCFKSMRDPRVTGRCQHALFDILAIIFVSTLAGADDFESMQDFAIGHKSWFRDRLGLGLKNGIPSHDTFNRVMNLLDPDEFAKSLKALVDLVAEQIPGMIAPQIAIDGKAMRGTKKTQIDGVKRMLFMVSAWATKEGLTLAQVRTAEKSNEITAIPKLLEMLDISGALVSIDAAGCQKEIAAQIVELKGDYLLQVKGNQKRLHDDICALIMQEIETDLSDLKYAEQPPEKRCHGRDEFRTCLVIDDLKKLKSGVRDFAKWKGLKIEN